MKYFSYIVLLAIAANFSCKEKYVRKLEQISGTWKLNKLEYQNSFGEYIIINKSKTLLTFSNEIDSKNPYGSKLGVIKNDNKSLNFKYSFDFSSSKCDLDFQQSDKESMPIDIIGKVQVYNFHFIDKSTIEFYAANEFDYPHKQIIKHIRYTFTKM